MHRFFGDGATRIWPATKVASLETLVSDRQSMVEQLEAAETLLIKRAYRKTIKQRKENTTQDLDDPTYESLPLAVKEAIRPKHHLTFPLVGKRVDTIQWLRERIKEKGSEVEETRRQHEQQDSQGAAAVFVEFETIADAQRASQQVPSAEILALHPKYLGVSPREVLWQNLPLPSERRISQEGIAVSIVIALIVFWSIPSGFVGLVSNINYLAEEVDWLAWLKNLPDPIVGLLSGLVPPLLTSLLSKYVPTIFRREYYIYSLSSPES